MNSNGVYKFIEYLEVLEQHITLYKGVVTSSEIMDELPLNEETIEVANMYLEQLQKDWSEQFVDYLKYGIEWIEKNKESKKW